MMPRYLVTWDVGKLLNYLAQWHPAKDIFLKKLNLKTVPLIYILKDHV